MAGTEQFILFCYILIRMSGFVLFNPIFGRSGIPGIVKAGFILIFTFVVASLSTASVAVPVTWIEFVGRLLLELFLGYLLGLVMNIFFMLPQVAGEAIDTQMGLTMGKIYDAGSQASLTVTSQVLNILMFLLFFAANGHHTLIRILLTSGNVVAFGGVHIGPQMLNAVIELFCYCILMSVKLALPILAAELLGQVGMGILMKAIPQINVFAINIELKVLLGLVMTLLLITPFSEFLLAMENEMLGALQDILHIAS